MPHILVLRGPTRAGKSTLARSIEGQPPDHFVLLQSDNPPSHVNPRPAQVEMWGSWVQEHLTAGQNVLLDCDLQAEWEARVLAQTSGVSLPGPDILIVRLWLSIAAAISRRNNMPIDDVIRFHTGHGAPPFPPERQVNTDGKSPGDVKVEVLELVCAKWPT